MARLSAVGDRRGACDTGAELLEFALVLPVLLIILVGIADFGFLFQCFQGLTNAAREGARLGVLPGYTSTDVQTRVQTYLTASGITAPATTTVAIVPATGAGPSFNVVEVTVESTYTFAWLAPVAALRGGTFSSVPLRARSAMRMEGP